MIKLDQIPGRCTVGSPLVWWCWQRQGWAGGGQAGGGLVLLFSIGLKVHVVTRGCTECAFAAELGCGPAAALIYVYIWVCV